MAEALLKTSIPQLDEMLKGGIKKESVTAFWGKPGVELAPFAYQLLAKRINDGEKVIYLTVSKRPDTILKEMKYYGWDLEAAHEEKRLIFVDAYAGLLKMPSKEKFVVDNPRKIASICQALKDAVSSIGGHKTVIVDSLSSLIDNLEQDGISFMTKCQQTMKETDSTVVLLFTEWEYKADLIKSVKELVENLVEIKTLEEKVILRTFFTVSRSDGKPFKGKDLPFKIISPGGIEIYIPKILVTGPYNSGKTSFIHSASTRAVSVDRFGTTIALDHGHVDYKGFSIDLFGTPGQERFDPILGLLGGQAFGVIIMLDSTDPAQFPRAKDMLKKIKGEGLPSVFVANKADYKEAVPPEKIRTLMELGKIVKIVVTRAENKENVRPNVPCKLKQEDVDSVFDVLFELIMKV